MTLLGPLALAALGLIVLITSFISGIFGMAGGMLLLGVLMLFLDVAPAMVMLGVIQTAANGWRVVLWLRHVAWGIVWRYTVGQVAMFAVLRSVSVIPDKALVYLGLGLLPLAADLLPRRFAPDITRPGAPYVCGAVIMGLQLVAGAAGHILDLMFQKSGLDRREIVATKAVTQTAGHLFRIAYFGSFAAAFDATVPWWVYAGAITLAVAGTSLAALVLERMTNESFRRWGRRIIYAISAALIARGLWLLVAR